MIVVYSFGFYRIPTADPISYFVYGHDGDNTIITGAGADVLFGGGGSDLLSGNGGDDMLFGGTGSDSLFGGLGNDFLSGDDGDDILISDVGDDYLKGGNGDDYLDGGEGFDTLDGGAGTDTASYAASFGSVFVSLGLGRGYGGTAVGDKLISIENLIGSQFSDILEGDSADNTFWGLDGDDTLTGGDGDDSLVGGDGDDEISGGKDDDTLDGGAGADVLSGGDGDDNLIGGQSDDKLYGGGGDDVLSPGDGENLVDGGTGIDLLTYQSTFSIEELWIDLHIGEAFLFDPVRSTRTWTTTIYNVENATGAQSNTHIRGDSASNVISGQEGNDTLIGGGGDDSLIGGGGYNILDGGDGDDSLFSDGQDPLGGNRLIGGLGADIFDFAIGGPRYDLGQIEDFSLAEDDRIRLQTGGAELVLTDDGLSGAGHAEAAIVDPDEPGGRALVLIDLDGDGSADQEIEVILAPHEVLTWDAFDLDL